MIVEYHPLFSEDLFRAAEYLEEQEENLGHRFIDTVEQACQKVQVGPEHFSYIEKPIRRILADPFAYAVHYELQADRLFFYGVFHCAMNPKRWLARHAED
jgi:hypothetical protein